MLPNGYDFYAVGNPVVTSAVKVLDDWVMKEIFYIPARLSLGLMIMMQQF